MKLLLFKKQLVQKTLTHFPTCQKLFPAGKDCGKYVSDIDKLVADFHQRFKNLQQLAPQVNLFTDPFNVEVESADVDAQMELIELQCNEQLKMRHREVKLIEFYKGLDAEKFPKIIDHAMKMASLFGTTYICEQTFSLMKLNKNRLRTRLTDEHLQDVLRLATSSFNPDINKLVSKKTCHNSH